MRILILTTSYPIDERDYAGIFIHKMARELAAKGHRLRVLCPAGPRSPSRQRMDGVRIERFAYFLKSRQTLAYGQGGIPENVRERPARALLVPPFTAAFALAAMRRAAWADVIHANWCLPAGLIGGLIARTRGTPLVVTVRGADMTLLKWRPGLTPLFSWILREADRVTTVSEALRAHVLRLGVGEEAALLLPSGASEAASLELSAAERARLDEARSDPRKKLLFVGSLIARKGIEDLLEAAALLGREEAVLYVVGEGPDRPKLETAARRLKVRDRVRFIGFQPFYAVPHWMELADLFVLPSLSEGRANVVYEAFAAGLPVVATDIEGTREVVRHEESGLLAPVKNPRALAEGVRRVLGDGRLRERLIRGGRRFLEEDELTWVACAERYSTVFEEARRDRKKRRG